MNVAPLQNQVSTADIPLEGLANNRTLSEEQKVSEASRQFEALLLRQILQETQKTVVHSEFTDNSTATGIYQDMVSNQLAESISKSGGLGLSHTLERQLNHQLHPSSSSAHHSTTASPATPARGATRPPALSKITSQPAHPFVGLVGASRLPVTHE